MRRVIGSSLVVSSVIVATGVLAQTPAAPTVKITPPTPIPTATVKPLQIPRLANARRALKPNGEPDTSLYSDGPLSWEVEIVNPNNQPLQTRLLITAHAWAPAYKTELPPVPVSVPASSRAWVKFTDPQGLISGCDSTHHVLRLEASGEEKRLEALPACMMAWKSLTLPDPHAELPPDRRAAMNAGKVWFRSVRVLTRSPPRCTFPFELEATVGNSHGSKDGVASIYLDTQGLLGTGLILRPREERVIRFHKDFYGKRKAVLGLNPPKSGARPPVISGTTTLETTLLCRINSVGLKEHSPAR